jgi:hypothetical protein
MSLGRIPTGVLGLLFDQQYGLIVNAPVFAVGLAGLVPLFRRHRRVAIEWLVVVVPYALVTAMYHMWWGGFSSPARFIGATFLLFALPAAMAWAAAGQAVTRGFQAAALGISLVAATMLVAVERGQFAFNVRDTAAPWLVWLGQIADVARGLPSLFRLGPVPASWEVGIWTMAVAGAWMAARAVAGVTRLRAGTAGLALLCAQAVAASVALGVVWRFEGVSGVASTTGQLRAVAAVSSRSVAHGVVFEPFALTSPGLALERTRIGLEPVGGAPAWAWLWLPNLPAGTYRLWLDSRPGGHGYDAAVLVGRSDGPLDEWRVEQVGAGASSRDLVLPVDVRSLAVRGNTDARGAVRALWLQPVSAGHRQLGLTPQQATAARRYGAFEIYALGNGAYLEPGGLWTEGGRTAELAVTAGPDQEGFAFVLSAGAVATPVEITAGAFSVRLTLAARESRGLLVPLRPGETALVRIRADNGFRPASVDPSSTDTRLLGVRLEPRSD